MEDARLGNQAGAGAAARARAARHGPPLGEPRRLAARARRRHLLVPALSLPEAFLAILVGSLIGNAMLGVAGMIGADARVPAMVLLRAPLGQRGSWGPTVLNAAQCIGWSVFELLVIATAAAALSDELFGFGAQWLWTLVFGGLALLLALLGPIDFVRKFVRKVGVWAVLASLLYLTWWALDGSGVGGLWDRRRRGRARPSGRASTSSSR